MTVWVARKVADAIASESRRLHPLEAGGVLLGWRDGDDRIVAGLVGPGPEALHGRLAFVPDHAWQVRKLREAFARTAGDLDYLGDWHTHPDGAARMSARDEGTLRRIMKRVRQPLMLIAAGGVPDWTMGAWIGVRRKLLSRPKFQPCDVRTFEPPATWPHEIVLV